LVGKTGDCRVPHAQTVTQLDDRLIKELWAFTDNRIAARFAMSGTTTAASGSVPMVTKTGTSMLLV
jgi:hypothetical protein